MHCLVVESDRVFSKLLTAACRESGMTVECCTEASEAVGAADRTKPDVVICELMLAGHSGMEFLYEFRSYTDWADIPVFIYSSLRPSKQILASPDWKRLGITAFYYKPDVSINTVVEAVREAASNAAASSRISL